MAAATDDDIPELTLEEEVQHEISVKGVPMDGRIEKCDLLLIEPYKRFVSHGGYDKKGRAIIVFASCYLPDSRHTENGKIMDNLFLWVMHVLDGLISDEYIVVYLHGGSLSRNLPGFLWMKRWYDQIEKRFKKDLKQLVIVHPTFWVKMLIRLAKPVVSEKFFKKIVLCHNIEAMAEYFPTDRIIFPDLVLSTNSLRSGTNNQSQGTTSTQDRYSITRLVEDDAKLEFVDLDSPLASTSVPDSTMHVHA